MTAPARLGRGAAVEATEGFVTGWVGGSVGAAGPGSGWSEEPITGVDRSAALDCEDAPECPPGPASVPFSVSATSCR